MAAIKTLSSEQFVEMHDCVKSVGIFKNLPAAAATQAAALDPGNLDFSYFAGVFLSDSRAWEDALKYFEAVASMRPGYRNVLFQMALAHQQLKDTARAVALYKRHLSAHPRHAQGWFNLGWAYKAEQQWRPAIQAFQECLRHDSRFREAHKNLAECFDGIGDARSAAQQRALYKRGG